MPIVKYIVLFIAGSVLFIAGSGADVDSRVKEISPGRFFASVDIPSALFR